MGDTAPSGSHLILTADEAVSRGVEICTAGGLVITEQVELNDPPGVFFFTAHPLEVEEHRRQDRSSTRDGVLGGTKALFVNRV